MTAITAHRLSREQFVNWIAEAGTGMPTLPHDTAALGEAKPSDVTLAWPKFQPDVRPIVCVSKAQLQDLFAFVSTYGGFHPFTAYFRVMPLELVGTLDRSKRERRDEIQLARMIAGASLAEAWLAAARQAERPGYVLPLLQSSLSFALGQAVLEGYDRIGFDWVLQEWMAIQAGPADLLRDQSHEGSTLAWLSVLSAVSQKSIDRSGKLIAAFIANAMEARSVRPNMLRQLSGIAGPEFDLVKLLTASREERISRFNAMLYDLKRRGERGLQSEFLAGLMLAIAGNGSFEMIRSAREFSGWLDGAVTWFGICAALFEESNVLVYANSAGRRIVRDLLRRDDPFGLPSADIASTELRFFDVSKSDIAQLAVRGLGSIEVEILPNVVTRILSRESGEPNRRAEENEVLLRTLDEMVHLATRARRMLRTPDRADRPSDLYKPSRPNRYR